VKRYKRLDTTLKSKPGDFFIHILIKNRIMSIILYGSAACQNFPDRIAPAIWRQANRLSPSFSLLA
jgi:hypothetical protein